ncbi:hypothetical protein IWQ57_001617 [Coemansia nantahalensis]|uniref:Uncharacterized protein n=2 Tax=Coemansia TaxID=4863 RepID=A0ACC1LGW4_9FUNG|nr:hypothetical protein IWQ57_001617 [Coemansia nantahalensis]KAJ2808033.1 hypothetical protein H4R21_000245 [Coemansia helicoidea]
MPPPVLVVTTLLPAAAQQRLDELPNVEVRQHRGLSHAELLAAVADADGLLCILSDAISRDVAQAGAGRLKVVSTVSVGYDHVDTAALRAHGIRLGYTPDVLTDATADTTVLLALLAARRAKEALAVVASGQGRGFSLSHNLGTQFTGKTLGIVGLGRIGLATALRLLPFGFARVVYSAPRAQDAHARAVGAQHVALDQLLAEADLVCVCCPLNADTRGLFDSRAFAQMKPSAILVNSARGAIVDQGDLLAALDAGQLAHAALDVTVPEPLPPNHPLVLHPRCTILPHIGSATIETRTAMANLAIDNAVAGMLGFPLSAEVPL